MCKYCSNKIGNKSMDINDKDNDLKVTVNIVFNELCIVDKEDNKTWMQINFCPICGEERKFD